jgi:hypothetical protein
MASMAGNPQHEIIGRTGLHESLVLLTGFTQQASGYAVPLEKVRGHHQDGRKYQQRDASHHDMVAKAAVTTIGAHVQRFAACPQFPWGPGDAMADDGAYLVKILPCGGGRGLTLS